MLKIKPSSAADGVVANIRRIYPACLRPSRWKVTLPQFAERSLGIAAAVYERKLITLNQLP